MFLHNLTAYLWITYLLLSPFFFAARGPTWSASWSWPDDQPTTFRNEFSSESDYNQLPTTVTDYNTLTDYNVHHYQHRVLTDEEIIDLLYSQPARSRLTAATVDHPTFLERTTYTALYDPEIHHNRQRPVGRLQESRRHPVVASYSHLIYH